MTAVEESHGDPSLGVDPDQPAAHAAPQARSGLRTTDVSAWFGSNKVLERVACSWSRARSPR